MKGFRESVRLAGLIPESRVEEGERRSTNQKLFEKSRRDLMNIAQCFSTGNKLQIIIESPVGTAE